MTTENNNPNDNDGTPSNDQQFTPPPKHNSFSEKSYGLNETHSTPNLTQTQKDLRQQYPSSTSHNNSTIIDNALIQNNEKQCYVCGKKFGVRRMRRKHTCRRCNHKVCGSCSSKKRYDKDNGTMVRVCDTCVSSEHCIVMTHRLRNLKLKHNKRNGGTYIVKVNQNSKEYYEGLINKCKIIEINQQNVESLNAQLIADKLNTIKIPFSITLDYSQAELKPDQLKHLKDRKRNINIKNIKKPSINKEISKSVSINQTPVDNSGEFRGTQRLINAHQNPYYFGAQQTYQPVIVTGPSADIRNLYKPGPPGVNIQQASFSDSFNDGYYEPREADMDHQGVIYEEPSPHRPKDSDDESGEDVSTSDDEGDSDTDDGESDSINKENTPQLMQYESDENENENNENENDNNGADRPTSIRAKSVPVTPILNGIKSKDGKAVTPTSLKSNTNGSGVFVEEVIKSITLNDDGENDIVSKTPKGNKSSNNILEIQERKKRSLSQDNLDPTSPPLMPANGINNKINNQTNNKIIDTPTPMGDEINNSKKKPIFKRKKSVKKEKDKKLKKHKKRKKDKKQLIFDDELNIKSNQKKSGKFLRRKKHMENYTNLHNNIHGLEDMRPVITSNVKDYTTQSLNPPNYTIMDSNNINNSMSNNMNGGYITPKRKQTKVQNHMGSLQAKQQQLRYTQYAQQNVARQRLEMQQHIVNSAHVLVNPYRQFSIAFNTRPFNIKLQFRNGFNAFTSVSSVHIQQSHTLTRPEYIWGWYSVGKHTQIPIGSKLISINFEWIYGKNQEEITQLMYDSPLPTTLIFEAPSYLNHVPPSIYIELNDIKEENKEQKHNDNEEDTSFSVVNYLNNNKSIIYWWLEEGGFVMILLSLLAFIVLDIPWGTQFKYYLPFITAFTTIVLMSIHPKEIFNLGWNIMHILVFKMNRKRRGSGLKLFGHTLLYGKGQQISYNNNYVSITNDQTLLNPFLPAHTEHMSSRRSVPHNINNYNNIEEEQTQQLNDKYKKKIKKHKKKIKKEQKDLEEDQKYEKDNENSSQSDDVKEDINGKITEEIDEVDPEWESNVCFPNGHSKIWGSFKPCSAKTLKLRGATYLNDRIKVPSEECLLSLANMDIFTVHHKIHHMAQNEVSWFYQNRKKLPKSLFFIIFHLRLDSMTASVVQYFYIDKNKFKHLLHSNDKVKEIAKEKGDGYFCIGGKGFDESGMFWNFVNGPCNYRNDRLKLLARKEEGPWYMQIPSRPAIIGRQVPIEYMRGYNANHLNSVKVHNTRSHAYDPYEFKTLYHDPNKKEPGNIKEDVPCDCGSCHWINTNGEYPEYIEVDICCEVNSLAKNTIRVACPLAKSLMVEMHWTMEGQINNVELPERMLACARLIHVDLTKLVEVD